MMSSDIFDCLEVGVGDLLDGRAGRGSEWDTLTDGKEGSCCCEERREKKGLSDGFYMPEKR